MDAIIHRGPISRAQIAKLTKISKQTASEVVRELEDDGLGSHPRPDQRQRRQVGGHLRDSARGGFRRRHRPRRHAVADGDRRSRLRRRRRALRGDLAGRRPGGHRPDRGARERGSPAKPASAPTRSGFSSSERPACSTPPPDRSASHPTFPASTAWTCWPRSRHGLGANVIIENDVNVGAIGERWLGRAKGLDTFAYVALGTGLGMAAIIDGQILRGAHGAAGEIANLPIGGDPFDPANRLHGTLESAVGSAGILRRYVEAGGAAGHDGTRALRPARKRSGGAPRARRDEPASCAGRRSRSPRPSTPRWSCSAAASAHERRSSRRCASILASAIAAPPGVEASALGNRAGIAGALAIAINNIHNALFAPSFSPRRAYPAGDRRDTRPWALPHERRRGAGDFVLPPGAIDRDQAIVTLPEAIRRDSITGNEAQFRRLSRRCAHRHRHDRRRPSAISFPAGRMCSA